MKQEESKIQARKIMNTKYHKIEGLFQREEQRPHKIIEGKYRNKSVEFLKDSQWVFTEKIDGTNIRIMWDGHKVSYRGRTEDAQIPVHLLDRLMELFGGSDNEEIFERIFGEAPACLYGEGYGKKIQKMGASYKSDGCDFILFDVKVGRWWLLRDDIEDIASKFSISVVPIIYKGTLNSAIEVVKGWLPSYFGEFEAEGMIGKPKVELFDRAGKRIIVKIKARDYK